MPVRRFRSLQEMEDSLWKPVGSPELYAAIASVWDFAQHTCPQRFPPGVHRHRSIEEAWALREQWEQDQVQALQRARAEAGGEAASQSGADAPPPIGAPTTSTQPPF